MMKKSELILPKKSVVKKYIFLIVNLILFNFFIYSQREKPPKNLKEAVISLEKKCSDSLKQQIAQSQDDELESILDNHGEIWQLVFEWIDPEPYVKTKLKKYFSREGIYSYNHRKMIIMAALKHYIIHNSIDEEKIIKPYREIEIEWIEEHKKRITLDSIDGIYIPMDIYDCLRQLDMILSDSLKIKIKQYNEDEFGVKAHFGLGRWIRNNWGLWGGSRLSHYFNKIGIYHPDDMSDIILTSYYRYLKGENIRLKEQIKYYKNYWKESERKIKKEYKKKKKFDSSTSKVLDINI